MFVRFLGAIGTVTGSMAELYHPESDKYFLVDCGMMQGELDADVPNWMEEPFPFNPKNLDFMILTHAHLDHIGLIPKLIREGFEGEIWCTEATKDLTLLSLEDSLNIMGASDANEILGKLRFHNPEPGFLTKRLTIAKNLSITFLRNAHILGACSVQISWKQDEDWRSIAFSGDIGINREDNAPLPLLGGQQPPYPADYVVLESTYGDTQREPLLRKERLQTFQELAHSVITENRIIILPSFAIQRAQDVLFDLHHALFDQKFSRKIPLIVHSPMMQKANRIMAEYLCKTEFKDRSNLDSNALRYLWANMETVEVLHLDPFTQRQELQYLFETALVGTNNVESVPEHFDGWDGQFKRFDNPDIDEAVAILKEEGGFVVASAGMCDNGPVVGYLQKLLPEERTTVALTGFCAPGTAGATLLRVGSLSAEQREEIANEQVLEFGQGNETKIPLSNIRADIFKLSHYSGHTDQNGIINWLTAPYSRMDGDTSITAFIVHGNEKGRDGLRDELHRRLDNDNLPGISDIKAILPASPDAWYDLSNQAALSTPSGLGLNQKPTPSTPLSALVPAYQNTAPTLERAIELDLVEPIRRAVSKESDIGQAFDLQLYIKRAWDAEAFDILKWAVSQGVRVEDIISPSPGLMWKCFDEDNSKRTQFLLAYLDPSTEELLEATKSAVDAQLWNTSEALIDELQKHSPSTDKISELVALGLLRYAPNRNVFLKLMESGINPDYIGSNGLSLLHLAAIGLAPGSRTQTLIEAGVDHWALTTAQEQNALHLVAIGTGFYAHHYWIGDDGRHYDLDDRNIRACNIAEILLDAAHGLIEQTDKLGRLPLHYAASIGSEGLSRLLVERASGRARSQYDNQGWRPCDLARVNGHAEVAEMLQP